MVARALHGTAHPTLVRRSLRWPLSAQELFGVLSLPPGFGKEFSYGRLRISRPERCVDDALLDLAGRLWDELPEGFRIEVYAGWIVVSGSPKMRHHVTVARFDEAIHDLARERAWMRFQTAAVGDPHTRAHCIPDHVVVPQDAPWFDDNVLGGDGVVLLTEVTSRDSVKDDREYKRAFYSAAGVPRYLVVDLEQGEVILHLGRSERGYREEIPVGLGQPLKLPAPFELTLDTGALVD
jgi:hypothetical protein